MGKIVLKVNKIVIPGINYFENEVLNVNPEEGKKNNVIQVQSSPQNTERKGVVLESPSVKNEEDKKIEKICRICLESECIKENPLIVPCNCKGTMQYVHLNCLKRWLFKKARK